MTMETFDPLRQTGGQQIGSDTETGAGSARVIEFGLYLRILGINTDATRNAAAFGHGQRIEAAELRQGIERDVAAATHDLREVRLGIGRGISMRLTAELFECQTGFVDGTGRGVSDVLPENGK